jgi:hypothetical protein
MLYRILKNGDITASLDIGEAFTHRVGKWLFLSPLFAKTAKPITLLPVAVAVLLVGGLGASYARLDPALFFYFPYSVLSQLGIVVLYVLNWVGLFLFADIHLFGLSANWEYSSIVHLCRVGDASFGGFSVHLPAAV